MDNQNSTAHQEDFDLVALVRVGWRYKLLVCAITLLCGVGTAIVMLVTKPIYRASVAVTQVRDSNIAGGLGSGIMSQLGGLASIAGLSLGGADENRTAQAVLKSRHLAEVFVKQNDLLPVLFEGSRTTPSLWKAVQRFQGILRIADDVRQGKTTISIDWEDPVVAAQWANDYVGLANEMLRSRARDESTRNIAYLNEQVSKTSVLELQRVMYNLIEMETKTLMLANGRTDYAFAVIDPAVAPELRISPKRTLMTITGLIGGGVLGLLVAVGLDFWRRRRTSPVLKNSAVA